MEFHVLIVLALSGVLVGVKLVGHFKKLWKYLLNEEYENHFLSA
jgi:hypothetical protein